MDGRRFWLPLAAALALGGCSDAKGTISGGDPRWDGAVFVESPPADASSADSGCPSASGCTWTALYRDFFGPSGKASCAGTGTCHGDTKQAGYQGSLYLCPNDQTGCYNGITSAQSGLLTPGKSFNATGLYVTLRKSDGSGLMPKQPSSVFFTPDELSRIGAWYSAGTPND
jgi:hypothetical protein